MSADIPNNMLLTDLLKATGYNCPENLEDKAFHEATSGGDGDSSRTPQELNITANGNYNTPDGVYYDPISVNVPLPEMRLTIAYVQSAKLTTVGTPVGFSYAWPIADDHFYVVWFGKEQINTRDLVAEQIYHYTTQGNGFTVDITLQKQEIGGARYRVTAVYKDRGAIYAPLICSFVVGSFSRFI